MWSTFFSSCASKDHFQNSLEDQLWPLVPLFFYTLIIDLKHAQRANINFYFNLAQISCEGSLLVTRLHSFQARRQPIEWKARLGACSLHIFFFFFHDSLNLSPRVRLSTEISAECSVRCPEASDREHLVERVWTVVPSYAGTQHIKNTAVLGGVFATPTQSLLTNCLTFHIYFPVTLFTS